MNLTKYAIELAREIIASKETKEVYLIPIVSSDTFFLQYKDQYIEIVSAKNTEALHVRINHPLTTAKTNPIIYVHDDGECYREHGEQKSFVMYAERLLGRDITIGLAEMHKNEQNEIDKLFNP